MEEDTKEVGSANGIKKSRRSLDLSNLGHPGVIVQWTPKRRMSVMAVIISTIGSFGLGMTLVWSAPALKYLKEDFGEISVTQSSIIGSIIYLGALISAPITGFLITTIGRKRTMLVTALPCILGWVIMASAQNLWMIYLGRFITGFCGGSFTVSVPTYVSEVTEDRMRGTLGTVFILMLVTGIEFTFILGAFVGWFWLTVVCAIVPLVFFISMLFMPESPRYLLITRQATAARRALQWLRRASTARHIEPEINQIRHSVEASTAGGTLTKTTFGDILTPSVLKALGVSIGLMGFAQLSGMNGIALYTSDVFEKAGTEMDSRFAGIIIWGGQAITVLFVTFFLVEYLHRKTLLLASLVVMIFGLFGFGLSFYLQEEGKVPQGLEWLPLTSLSTFIVGYNLGMGPLPWLVTNEVLPPRVREMGSSIVTLFYWSLSFIAGITFNSLETFLGSVILYWGHAGVCFLGVLFVYFLVPETKSKDPDQIESYFGGRKRGESDGVGLEIVMSPGVVSDKDGLGISNPNFKDEDALHNT